MTSQLALTILSPIGSALLAIVLKDFFDRRRATSDKRNDRADAASVAQITASSEDRKTLLEETKWTLQQLKEDAEESRVTCKKMQSDLDALHSESLQQKEKIRDLTRSVEKLHDALAAEHEAVQMAKVELGGAQVRVDDAERERNELRVERVELKRQISVLQAQVRELQEEIKGMKLIM